MSFADLKGKVLVARHKNRLRRNRSLVWLALLMISVVLVGCSAEGGGGDPSNLAPLDVIVTFDELEHCVSGDMNITATISNLDTVMMEGVTLGLDQTTATMDWVIFQTQPGGGDVKAPGSTGVTNSYSDIFAAGDDVGTGQARARAELIMQDEDGQNRTIVGQGESDSKPFEVKQCLTINLEYAGIYDRDGVRIAEEVTSSTAINLTGPPEGPFSGQGKLDLMVELFFESGDDECFVDPPWKGTSDVRVDAELDENQQVLIFNFDFAKGIGEGGVLTCIVDGQAFTPPAGPGAYNPNEWKLQDVEVPLSGGQQVVSIPSGFFGGVGDGAVKVTIQAQP